MGTEQWQKIQKWEIMPQDYRRYISALSPSVTKRWMAEFRQNWPGRQRVVASQNCCLWWFCSVWVKKPSNHDSPPPSVCSKWTTSSSTGPEIQGHLMQSVDGIVWKAAIQTTDNHSVFAKTTNTRNGEQSWNVTEKSPSETIHTIVERFFQQRSTTLAAGTSKMHWSTTSESYQTSCHNGTSASRLASRFNLIWVVNPTRRNQNSFTNAYENTKHIQMSQT